MISKEIRFVSEKLKGTGLVGGIPLVHRLDTDISRLTTRVQLRVDGGGALGA
jgi:hypothetical protein